MKRLVCWLIGHAYGKVGTPVWEVAPAAWVVAQNVAVVRCRRCRKLEIQ